MTTPEIIAVLETIQKHIAYERAEPAVELLATLLDRLRAVEPEEPKVREQVRDDLQYGHFPR